MAGVKSWLTNCRHVDLDKFMCQGLNTPYENCKLCSDHYEDSQFLNLCLHNGLVIDIVCCYCIWILWHGCKLVSTFCYQGGANEVMFCPAFVWLSVCLLGTLCKNCWSGSSWKFYRRCIHILEVIWNPDDMDYWSGVQIWSRSPCALRMLLFWIATADCKAWDSTAVVGVLNWAVL